MVLAVLDGSGSYQAVAVAESHHAGVGLTMQVAYIETLGGIRVAPGQTAPPPVLHTELVGQQAPLQGQVEEEVSFGGGELVVQLGQVLLLVLSTAVAPPGVVGAVCTAILCVQGLALRPPTHRDDTFILTQAGQERSWTETERGERERERERESDRAQMSNLTFQLNFGKIYSMCIIIKA